MRCHWSWRIPFRFVVGAFAVAIGALLAVAWSNPIAAVASSGTTVTFDPQSIPLESGGTTTVAVVVQNVTDTSGLGAYDLTACYDQTVVTVSSVSGGDPPFGGTPTSQIGYPTSDCTRFNAFLSSLQGPTGDVTVARLHITGVGSTGASSSLTISVNTLSDGNGADITPVTTVSADITISCTACPTAADDSYSATAGVPLDIASPGVLSNDTDPQHNPLTANIVSSVSHGTLHLNSDGSFQYTADSGFTGSDSFTYKANNGTQDSNVATVAIAVAAPQLIFTAQPGNATAGSPFEQQPVVTAEDASGNVATGFSGSVSVAISQGTGPSGATLLGTAMVNAVNGVATFHSLQINKAGSGYQLAANASGLQSVDSQGFAVGPGAASTLSFTTQPGGAKSGSAFSQQPVVTAYDAYGNMATGFQGQVTVGIAAGTGPSAAILSGATAVNAANGIASFTNLQIDTAGTGYKLTASAPNLSSATSDAFSVLAGNANRLVFTTQPGNATAGSPFTQQPVVKVEDGSGNVVSTFNGQVAVAITSNSGPSGAVLLGATTTTASSGVASFTNLQINKASAGYTLTASAAGLASGTSDPFSVSPAAASSMAFTTQPRGAVVHAAFTQQPVVAAQDAFGNTATGFTGSVTVAITPGSGASGASLSGSTTVNAVSGVAVFTGLEIDTVGASYSLTASANGLSSTTSHGFDVAPGPASQLVFSTQPGGATAGNPLAPQPVVTAQDAYGNTATAFNGSVTVTIASGTGASGATVLGTTTTRAQAGVASFAGLHIDKAATGYKLTASAASLASATSLSFDIGPGTPSQLAFTGQPADATAGHPFGTQPTVSVEDQFGNVVPNATNTISVAIPPGTGPTGASLIGTTTITAQSGVATFANLQINKAGAGYWLAASTPGLSLATSDAFSVSPGSAVALSFTTQPSGAVVHSAFSQQPVVTAEDAFGNTATGFTGSVTVVITPGSGASGASLSGSTTVNAISGVAVFTGLEIDTVGANYSLTTSANGLSSTSSLGFDVAPGPATQLVFSTQPGDATAGDPLSSQLVVTAQDAYGNTATAFNGSVTVVIASGTGASGATLLGTTTTRAPAGVASFAGLHIDKAATGYKLTASAASLASATSLSFDISPGPPSQVAFTTDPGFATAGSAFDRQPMVSVQDRFGNLVPTATNTVVVTITAGTGSAGATLSGSTTLNATAGIAQFTNLAIDKAAGGYSLTATSTGLNPGTSTPFGVVQPVAAPTGGNVQIVEPDATSTVASTSTGVQVQMPAGSITETSQVEYKPIDTSKAPPPPSREHVLKAFELNVFDAVGQQQQSVHLNRTVTIRVNYTQADLDGVDGDASRLVVMWYKPASKTWVQLATTPDTAHMQLVATVDHFTLFGMGSLPPAGPAPTATPPPPPTPTPLPPLTTVSANEVTPVPSGGGLTAIVQPNLSTSIESTSTGITVKIPAPIQQQTLQIHLLPMSKADLTSTPSGTVLQALRLDLFDVNGAPLPEVQLWHPVSLEIKPSPNEIAEIGGASGVLTEAISGRIQFERLTGASSGQAWIPIATSYDATTQTFSASLSHFSIYALVWTPSGAEAPSTVTATATQAATTVATEGPTPTAVLPSTGGPTPPTAWVLLGVLVGVVLLGGGLVTVRRRDHKTAPRT